MPYPYAESYAYPPYMHSSMMYGGRLMGPLMNTRAELYRHEAASQGALFGGLTGAGAGAAAIGLASLSATGVGLPIALLALGLTGAGAALGYGGGNAYATYRDTMDNGIRDGSPLAYESGGEYGPVVDPYRMMGMNGYW